jgi:hypothetical protein
MLFRILRTSALIVFTTILIVCLAAVLYIVGVYAQHLLLVALLVGSDAGAVLAVLVVMVGFGAICLIAYAAFRP